MVEKDSKIEIEIFSFEPIDSCMYILIEQQNALIIDPCPSEEALSYLQKNGVNKTQVLLTHEHYDHISGVNWLRNHFHNVNVLCSKSCAEAISNSHKNMAAFANALYMDKQLDKTLEEYGWEFDYSCYADATFEGEMEFNWEGHHFFLIQAPGHSKGSICIIMDNRTLFSGDSLVTGHPTITRLPGGSKKIFQEVTIPFLKSLDSEMLVYPGHGEPQLLKEYSL